MKPIVLIIVFILLFSSCKNGEHYKSDSKENTVQNENIKLDSLLKGNGSIDLNIILKDLSSGAAIYSNSNGDSLLYCFKTKFDLVDSLLYGMYFIDCLPKNMQPAFKNVFIQSMIKSKNRLCKLYSYIDGYRVLDKIERIKYNYRNNFEAYDEIVKLISKKYIYFERFANIIKGYNKTDTIIGDFNGDAEKEFATVRWTWNQKSSYDAGKCTIIFSDKSIPKIPLEEITDLLLVNEGDLNCDGKDEIGLLPGGGPTGCRTYYLITLSKNKWYSICEPIENTIGMRKVGVKLIEKDTINKGYIFTRNSLPSSGCSSPSAYEKHIKCGVD